MKKVRKWKERKNDLDKERKKKEWKKEKVNKGYIDI